MQVLHVCYYNGPADCFKNLMVELTKIDIHEILLKTEHMTCTHIETMLKHRANTHSSIIIYTYIVRHYATHFTSEQAAGG